MKTSSLTTGQHGKPAQSDWINSALDEACGIYSALHRLIFWMTAASPMNSTTGSLSALSKPQEIFFLPAEKRFSVFAKAHRAHELKCGCQDGFICHLQYVDPHGSWPGADNTAAPCSRWLVASLLAGGPMGGDRGSIQPKQKSHTLHREWKLQFSL